MVNAMDADWVSVPTYELGDLQDGHKGDPTGVTPIRRDWLNRTLGTETGLWLAAAPCDYPPAGIAEGDKVLLRDVSAGELHERHLCVWRETESSRLFIGRFSGVRHEPLHVGPDGEYWIGRMAIAAQDDAVEMSPVGRIVGRPIAQIR